MKPTVVTNLTFAISAILLPFSPAGAQQQDRTSHTAQTAHAALDRHTHAASAAASGSGAVAGPWSLPAADIALPANSVYQVTTPMTDATGQRFMLKDLAGAPVLVTMFYGDCHSACPVVIETLKRTVTALGPDGRSLRILLISLDPKRDTPKSLAMMAAMQKLDPAQYRLAVAGNDTDTRMLASALDIRYRPLDNGEISHTTRIAMLNPDGSVRADSNSLAVDPDPEFVRKIAAAVKR